MTNEQYENYKKKKEELESIKGFLFWCGNRYKKTDYSYNFSIRTKCKDFFMNRSLIFSKEEKNYKMPKELQTRIVKVIEDYVDEVEKEMEEI